MIAVQIFRFVEIRNHVSGSLLYILQFACCISHDISSRFHGGLTVDSSTEQDMKESQLEKMSLKDLKVLRNKVEKAIRSRHDRERAELRTRMKQMAEHAGFSLSDLFGGKAGKRGPVSAKFAHPDNPSLTWSGRGRMPKWLSEKVKAGASPQDFRI
jgi:DNA-binding protein H-NS